MVLPRALFEGAGEGWLDKGKRTVCGQDGNSPGKRMLPWFRKGSVMKWSSVLPPLIGIARIKSVETGNRVDPDGAKGGLQPYNPGIFWETRTT